MLEGDVQVDKSGTVIMAHPPETTSDLTLEQFLTGALDNKKGVKLDFKSPEASAAGFPLVNKMKPEV